MNSNNQRLSRFLHDNNINVALDHIIDFLKTEGFVDLNRNSKIDVDVQQKLLIKFKSETKEQLIIKHKEDSEEEEIVNPFLESDNIELKDKNQEEKVDQASKEDKEVIGRSS